MAEQPSREAAPRASGTAPRYPALDGLRALAIILVMLHHTVSFGHGGQQTRLEEAIGYVCGEGWIGVDLFFALSGYLITGILLRTKGSQGYFSNFMMRRVLRIFPAYYLFLFVFFIVLPRLFPAHPGLAVLQPDQLWYWFYLPNVRIFLRGDWHALYVEHAWSLAIEEQFYLVWPLIVALCSRRTLIAICALCVPASLALRVLLISGGGGRATAFVLPPTHLDGLMLGAILAAVESRLVLLPHRGRRWLLAVGVFGLACLGLLVRLPWSYDMKHYALSVTAWSLVFVALVGGIVTAPEGSRLARALSSRPLRRIGTCSYGLYLWHQPIFRELEKRLEGVGGPLLARWALLAALGGGISFIVASLLYDHFELRFLGLKRFFESGSRRTGSAAK